MYLPSQVKTIGSGAKSVYTRILTDIEDCCLVHKGLTMNPRFVFVSVDLYLDFNL